MDYRKQILQEITETLLSIELSGLMTIVNRIDKTKRVFCDGLGRSSLAMRSFAMRLMQLGFQSSMVGEVTAPALVEGDLLLICTASGSSPVLLHHAQQAKKNNGAVVVITGNPISSIVTLADHIILIPVSSKDNSFSESSSIQPMGSLFEQTAQLLCEAVVLELMEKYKISEVDMRKRHANIE